MKLNLRFDLTAYITDCGVGGVKEREERQAKDEIRSFNTDILLQKTGSGRRCRLFARRSDFSHIQIQIQYQPRQDPLPDTADQTGRDGFPHYYGVLKSQLYFFKCIYNI
jgi:hypothetical protein